MAFNKVIIGSRACKFWFPDSRTPKDWDYLWEGPTQKLKNEEGEVEEYHNVNELRGNRLIYDMTEKTGDVSYAPPELLYSLKVSTIFFVPHFFEKTAHDLMFFQQKGVKHNEELYNILYEDFKAFHGRRANLRKTNEDFFKDNVQRKYVHDDIHRAVAYYDAPLYERCKPDPNSAYVSEKMFNQLRHSDKIRMCREEIFTTALERVLIPNNLRGSILGAYRNACKQLICSMTAGWFPKFIVLNWLELNRPDGHDFVNLFKERFCL